MGMKAKPADPSFSQATSVADALFTKSQQRVLGILFGNPNRTFYASEIIALADSGSGAVQRELAKLEAAGLVVVHHVGNQKHYQPNTAAAVFKPLRDLILKTSGVADVLRAALAPIAAEIRAAFVYGSVAKGKDKATSDVDLMVISDSLFGDRGELMGLSYSDLFVAVESAARRMGRTVNPTLYSSTEWIKRLEKRNSFVTRALAQPKIWVLGSDNELPTR